MILLLPRQERARGEILGKILAGKVVEEVLHRCRVPGEREDFIHFSALCVEKRSQMLRCPVYFTPNL